MLAGAAGPEASLSLHVTKRQAKIRGPKNRFNMVQISLEGNTTQAKQLSLLPHIRRERSAQSTASLPHNFPP